MNLAGSHLGRSRDNIEAMTKGVDPSLGVIRVTASRFDTSKVDEQVDGVRNAFSTARPGAHAAKYMNG